MPKIKRRCILDWLNGIKGQIDFGSADLEKT